MAVVPSCSVAIRLGAAAAPPSEEDHGPAGPCKFSVPEGLPPTPPVNVIVQAYSLEAVLKQYNSEGVCRPEDGADFGAAHSFGHVPAERTVVLDNA
jgi:hypothetical protein